MRASDEGSTERPVLEQRIRIAATTVTNQRFVLVIFLFVPNVKLTSPGREVSQVWLSDWLHASYVFSYPFYNWFDWSQFPFKQ
jgi:hypothetical protein